MMKVKMKKKTTKITGYHHLITIQIILLVQKITSITLHLFIMGPQHPTKHDVVTVLLFATKQVMGVANPISALAMSFKNP